MLRRQPHKKRAGEEDGSGKPCEKVTQKRERSPTQEKAVILSSKRSTTTKKNSWVDKDLTKIPKKKCFEENGAVQNAIKNKTTKNWVQEELSKFPVQKQTKKKTKQKRH